ncbi:hypothetical protein A1O3_00096 [Capronia epimyces CBS 606.96]|uniref:Altered inheritance of mitochondria protein 32 n=1 Tax=Capronia epimyces CBS 606.96 TaxID=1182542 RepID=W9YG86_9EURO|nr:uncharacterized protein A1O3_00096 [Capronia epimyces CBS 606.96]EXJ91548.1 hypothetical protein A1O3_00096 [Capronia epimyces CBS 606.96]
MPAGLDIERTYNLNGTMSPYAQHLIISTGRSDWTSRIEDERDTAVWGRFTAEIKAVLGRGGEFHDPFNNIIISTSSFKPWQLAKRDVLMQRQTGKDQVVSVQAQSEVDALLFPAFLHVRGLNLDADPDLLRKFVRSSLLPEPDRLHPIYSDLSDSERRAKTRDVGAGRFLVRPSVEAPTILICSHGQRDSRCGILGPLLHAEFARYMDQRQVDERGVRLVPRTGEFIRRDDAPRGSSIEASTGAGSGTSADEDDGVSSQLSRSPSSSSPDPTKHIDKRINVNVGMLSHVGGHKWAGNVILYIPPTFASHRPSSASSSSSSRARSSLSNLYPRPHPLAGMGIWYGRVEPRHVEGIVEQTLMQGKVIRELFRGGVSTTGEILRL